MKALLFVAMLFLCSCQTVYIMEGSRYDKGLRCEGWSMPIKNTDLDCVVKVVHKEDFRKVSVKIEQRKGYKVKEQENKFVITPFH